MDTLLNKVQLATDARLSKSTNQYTPGRNNNSTYPHKPPRLNLSNKSCPLCKQAGRQSNHFLSCCQYLPDDDRKYQIAAFDEANDDDEIST